MTDDFFELPDMDDIARQMQDAMEEAQQAMEDLPEQMEEMGDLMGSLSALMGGLPDQMGDLGEALSAFGGQHAANLESLAGEPNWGVDASIQVGKMLHIAVNAVFDLEKIRETWNSTQGAGFESLVKGVAAEAGDFDDSTMGQIMGQLKQGRGVAMIKNVDILACHIQGAPANAAEQLQLSPEGNIPLSLNEGGICFEFAPMLTIRNRWENANIPSFSPMGEEIVVPLAKFEEENTFRLQFKPTRQEKEMVVELSFHPLD